MLEEIWHFAIISPWCMMLASMLTSHQNDLYKNCSSLIDLDNAVLTLAAVLLFLISAGADKTLARTCIFPSQPGLGLKFQGLVRSQKVPIK